MQTVGKLPSDERVFFTLCGALSASAATKERRSFCGIHERNIHMKKFNIKTLTLLGMFTAVSVVLARLLGFYLTESLRVSFEYFAIILAGICFGPLAGAVVGGLSDFIGANLISGFGFYPPLIIGPILAGLLGGLLSKYVFHGNPDRWWKIMTVVAVSEIIANLLWGSFALSLLQGTPFLTILALRTPLKLAIMVMDAQLVYAVYSALRPILGGRK